MIFNVFKDTDYKIYRETYWRQIKKLNNELEAADAVIIGAGAGLSTSAGFVYNGRDSIDTLGILKKNMDFMTCIPAVLSFLQHWRNTGHTGAVLSITIATLITKIYLSGLAFTGEK